MNSVGNGLSADAALALVARPAVSGSVSPSGGKSPPPEVAAAKAPPPPDLSESVRRLNQIMSDSQRALRFRVDESSGRTIITVVNPDTGEIVRQIPSAERLIMARLLAADGASGLVSVRT